MKYIVIEYTLGTGETASTWEAPFIFSSQVVHLTFARKVLAGRLFGDAKGRVVSAGNFNPFTGSCTGRSESLNVDSRTEDSILIRMCDYGAGLKL